jgi:hypothetical protein
LGSIGPAEDTLSERFINNNQDLAYQLTIKSSPAGLESANRCGGRAVCIASGDWKDYGGHKSRACQLRMTISHEPEISKEYFRRKIIQNIRLRPQDPPLSYSSLFPFILDAAKTL